MMNIYRIVGFVIVSLAGCATVKVTKGGNVAAGRLQCGESVQVWHTEDPNAVCDIRLTYTGCAACTAKVSGVSQGNTPFTLQQTSSSTTDRVSNTARARSLDLACEIKADPLPEDGCTYSIDDVQCAAGSRESSIQSLPPAAAVDCGQARELWSSGAPTRRCNVTVELKGTSTGCQATVTGRTGAGDQMSTTGEAAQLVTLVGVLSVGARCGSGNGPGQCMFAVKEIECN